MQQSVSEGARDRGLQGSPMGLRGLLVPTAFSRVGELRGKGWFQDTEEQKEAGMESEQSGDEWLR